VSEYPCCGAFCTGEVHFGIWLRLRDCLPRPGLGPAADLLFFASPKKRRQKKGDPTVCVPPLRYGQPAVLDVGGGPQNSLRSNSCGPYPSYVCAPRHSQKGATRAVAALGYRTAWTGLRFARPHIDAARLHQTRLPIPSTASAKRLLCLGGRATRWPGYPHPLWLRRGAQRFADQGSPLSERSEFGRDPAKREHRRLPAAKRRDADSGVAFSLPTFFWRSKRK